MFNKTCSGNRSIGKRFIFEQQVPEYQVHLLLVDQELSKRRPLQGILELKSIFTATFIE